MSIAPGQSLITGDSQGAVAARSSTGWSWGKKPILGSWYLFIDPSVRDLVKITMPASSETQGSPSFKVWQHALIFYLQYHILQTLKKKKSFFPAQMLCNKAQELPVGWSGSEILSYINIEPAMKGHPNFLWPSYNCGPQHFDLWQESIASLQLSNGLLALFPLEE